MDLDNIFACKTITKSSLDLYKSKLNILNDNKPIKNINFLYDIEKIQEKIKDLKPNTRRTYIIAITSILKCMTSGDNKPTKKLKGLYDSYSKLLDEYNTSLKDQTEITEGTKIMSEVDIKDIYDELKKNKANNKQSLQDFTILSLYTLIQPRRNKDYALLKKVEKFSENLPLDSNYYDGTNKLYFNAYKTRGKYALQDKDIPNELKDILDEYITANDIKNDDYIFKNLKNNKPLLANNAMTLILNRIFKGKVGSSMLRRSFFSNKYSDVSQELKEDAKAMGTSVDVANSNYIKKKKK